MNEDRQLLGPTSKRLLDQYHADHQRPSSDTVDPLVRLSSSFTQIEMDPLDRDAAVKDAHFRTLSPHEWTWTPWQQARMALYVLWASQRLAAVRYLAEGRQLEHEPEKRTACRDCGLPGPFRGGLCAGCADAIDAEEPNVKGDWR